MEIKLKENMKYITIYACVLAFLVALAAMWPQTMPHWTRQHGYSVKDFCAEHPDICSKNRLARYHTPTPIPQGMIVINP